MREVCYQVHAILQSGYRDLNSGPPGPKPGALAKLSHTPKYKTLIITDLQSVVLLRQINCCLGVFKILATGIEPVTPTLSEWCSNLLSYASKMILRESSYSGLI